MATIGLNDRALKELLEEFKELLPFMPVSIKDLRFPKRDFMMDFFRTFLYDFSEDEFTSNVVKPEASCDCPDLVMHSYFPVLLLQRVKKVYPAKLGMLQNMSIDALLDPKPTDIQYIKASLNYLRFSRNRLALYAEDPEDIQLKSLEVKVEECSKKINEMKELIPQQRVDINEMENSITELEEVIMKAKEENQSEKLSMEDELALMREREENKSRLALEVNALSAKLAEKSERAGGLSAFIFHSPDRIQLTKQEWENKKTNMKTDVEALYTAHYEKKKISEMLNTVEEDQRGYMDILDKCLSPVDGIEAKRQTIKKSTQLEKKAHIKEEKRKNELEQMKILALAEEKRMKSLAKVSQKPLDEGLSDFEKKVEKISGVISSCEFDFKEKQAAVETLEKQYCLLEKTRKEEQDSFTTNFKRNSDKMHEFNAHTDRTWAGIVENRKAEIKELEEYVNKELEDMASLIRD